MTEMKYCGKPLMHAGEEIEKVQQAGLHYDHSPYYQTIQHYRPGRQ